MYFLKKNILDFFTRKFRKFGRRRRSSSSGTKNSKKLLVVRSITQVHDPSCKEDEDKSFIPSAAPNEIGKEFKSENNMCGQLKTTTSTGSGSESSRDNNKINSDGEMCNVLESLRLELEADFVRVGPCHTRSSSKQQLLRENASSADKTTFRWSYSSTRRKLSPYSRLLTEYNDNDRISYNDEHHMSEFILHKAIEMERLAAPLEMIIRYNDENSTILTNTRSRPGSLHLTCKFNTSYEDWIQAVYANDQRTINLRNNYGQTPLHLLILGNPGEVRKDWKKVAETLKTLVLYGADVNLHDEAGETPLLYLRFLLKDGLFQEATAVANVLLQSGADVNAATPDGRSLLMYSVSHLDDSVELTRLLLNSGARVWTEPYGVGGGSGGGLVSMMTASFDGTGHHQLQPQQSAFEWFLKAVIYHRRLVNCRMTLALLIQIMGQAPRHMYKHVLRTMFRHVRCFRVFGPLFLQIKLNMVPYWNQPHDLKYQCFKAVRKALGPNRIESGVPQLGLPRPMERYLLMK